MSNTSLVVLRDLIRAFVKERNWEKIDTPRNLATALCVEAAELLEPFQWLNSGDANELGTDNFAHVQEEMADVLIYLIALADKLEIDLIDAAVQKIATNAEKYPAEKVNLDAMKL